MGAGSKHPAARLQSRTMGKLFATLVVGLCVRLPANPADDPPAGVAAAAAYSEAESLRTRGEVASLRQALEKYQNALALYRKANDGSSQAKTLYGEGRAHDSLSEKRKALDCYLQALPMFRALGNRAGEAETLIYMALDYTFLGEAEKARIALAEALAAGHASGDQRARAVLFTHAGEVCDQLGERQRALEYFNEALPLQRASGNQRGEATALGGIGAVYYAMGEAQKALDHLNPALELYRAVRDLRDEGFVLATIGAVHYSRDDYTQALSYYRQALPKLQQAGDRSSESATLHNIATSYERLGQLENAIEYYNRALPIHRAAGYSIGEANTFASIGRLHMALGDISAALDYYNRALPLQRASGNRGLEGRTLHSMGIAYDALGDRQKALHYYMQALPLRRATADHSGEADTLDRIAKEYAVHDDPRKALDFANQSLALYRAVGSRRGEAASLSTLGLTHAMAGETEEALEFHTQGLQLFRSVGDRMGTAGSLYSIARLEIGRNRLREARSHVEEALDIVESLRAQVASLELRSSYFASIRDYFDLDIDLLMQLDREQPAAGFRAAAFEVSERSRARSFLDTISETSVDIREGVDPELLERERTLKQKLNAKADRQLELLRGKRTEQELAAAADEIARLTDDYRNIEAEVRVKSPHYAALTHPQTLSLQNVQREVLDADTLLLQYSLGLERSYVWMVSRTSIAAFALPPRAEIEAAARRFHELASTEDQKAAAAARTLSEMVLAPLAGQLGSKRLAVVADGALEYVPFAALPTPGATDGRPLLADHEIVSLPSCSAVQILRAEMAARKPAPARRTLAILADPVFRKEDSRVGTSAASAGAPASDSGRRQRAAELNLVRLSGSRKEARSILAMVPEAQRKEALDFDASLATVTAPELAQYRIVHLATHAFLDTEHPELSSIVLSLVNRDGRLQDGILRLHEIYNLRWQADLVVLSACQTALGKHIKGEGFIGLTRGFMYAGAPRVAASLWKVDDRATAELMKSFYEAMLAPHGLPPAAALRAAQIKLLHQKKWQASYYWAAFVLQGDWL